MSPLPELLVLTDRRQAGRPDYRGAERSDRRGAEWPLVDVIAAAVEGGARAVVLREKDLPDAERAALGVQLRDVLAPVDGVLIAASRPLPGVDAVHLAASDSLPAPRPRLVGRSCHDAAEVDAATTTGLDYVTVSPVRLTASKPGYGPALGLHGLAALCARTPLPVYALGGVTVDIAAECVGAGAAGVAVMGAVMRAPDPAAIVAGLLDRVRPAAADPADDPVRKLARDPAQNPADNPATTSGRRLDQRQEPVAGGAG